MVDEEALAQHLKVDERRETGAFFTPRPLVDRVLELVRPWVPEGLPLDLVDPACGAGAFLVAGGQRFPQARLKGFELDARSAALAQQRAPSAHIEVGDALTASWPVSDRFTLWVGNPPYNGTSRLLKNPAAWNLARALPGGLALPKYTSLRDDYVFFLLAAVRALRGGHGALAFITSATLLDAFNYAPVRQVLLEALQLREVVDLGAGAFTGTQVRTCITVWTTQRDERPAHAEGRPFIPRAPTWVLRPLNEAAEALDLTWRAGGATLDELVPVSFPGLKTRFDELLVDDDRAVLEARVRDFLSCDTLEGFSKRHELPDRVWPKLRQLKEQAAGVRWNDDAVHRFIRYRGPRPRAATAWCYVDRRLIPRGDHRFRGAWNPHRSRIKLVFNRHELPLAAEVLDEEGCVTAYRHSRFAPLMVPRVLLAEPSRQSLDADEPLTANLTSLGLEWAARLGSPRAVFEHIARHVMSHEFQQTWAPAHGTVSSPLIRAP